MTPLCLCMGLLCILCSLLQLPHVFFLAHSPVQTHLQSQRALLIQGTASLNNASASIERSQRIAAETDHIGNDIIEELGEQREQLDRTRDRVRLIYDG